jgi:hypothetical protein
MHLFDRNTTACGVDFSYLFFVTSHHPTNASEFNVFGKRKETIELTVITGSLYLAVL